ALQIFTRNQRQWRAAPVSAEEAAAYQAAWAEAGKPPVASHDSYLINLAAGKEETAAKSMAALADELARCQALGIPIWSCIPAPTSAKGSKRGWPVSAATSTRCWPTVTPG
ncbi:MAG: hypothetical protein OEV73_13360, partial [Desulfobulbaceae bacterium]|nr:hypothetical protein [Desulfobulbaceae bacterium]